MDIKVRESTYIRVVILINKILNLIDTEMILPRYEDFCTEHYIR